MHFDRHCSELAERQHGLLTRHQARTVGTERQIDHRLDSGVWVVVEPRVDRHTAAPPSWRSDLLAVCLCTGGVASHWSAAALWALDGFSHRKANVTIPEARWVERPATRCRLRESTQFHLIDPVVIDEIPTTDIGRTLLDIAAVASFDRFEWAVDQALRRELIDWRDLARVLRRHARPGRNGVAALRALLEERYGDDVVPDAKWNRDVARHLIRDGTPPPALEWSVVTAAGEFVSRLDLAWPTLRVGVELDSLRWHLDRGQFEKDHRQRDRLRSLGWDIRSYTWHDWSERRDAMATSIRDALRRATTKSPGSPTSGVGEPEELREAG